MNLRLSFFVPLLLMITHHSFAQIYNVGNDDGFSVSCYAQANNPMLAIYSVGNDDGFSVSCYAQADNPMLAIYSVGNDDGFGFSCVGGVGTEVPLPIELINFMAYVRNDWVYLEWQTASEINNNYFTIERSIDAVNFKPIGTKQGAGNSSTLQYYNYIDSILNLKPQTSNILYYRLKQTDFDGQYEYSAIRAVNIKQNTAEVVIYPNPVNSQITIQADEQELSSIRIYNILGQDVTNLTKQLSKTDNSIIIDLSNLANGIYSVRTQTTANKVYKK